MTDDPAQALGGGVFLALVLLIPVWRIFRRAGFQPAWSLLMFIPGVGFLITACMLAFSRWPAFATPAVR